MSVLCPVDEADLRCMAVQVIYYVTGDMMSGSEGRDFVAELGQGVLPHQLRRLMDTLVKWEMSEAERLGLSVPLKTHSMMLLLSRHGPLRLGDVVEQLRLSRPLIVKFADKLVAMGMVSEKRPSSDRRIRLLDLTEGGRQEAARIEAFLETAAGRYRDLGKALDTDLLDLVTQARKRADTW